MCNEECCGTCLWHRKQGGEWVCTNSDSDYYGLETGYEDECELQEARQ